jgi:hypothetical protein
MRIRRRRRWRADRVCDVTRNGFESKGYRGAHAKRMAVSIESPRPPIAERHNARAHTHKKKVGQRGRLTDELADGDLLVERALRRALVLSQVERLAHPEQLGAGQRSTSRSTFRSGGGGRTYLADHDDEHEAEEGGDPAEDLCGKVSVSRSGPHGLRGMCGGEGGAGLRLGLLTSARPWFESMRMMEKRMERRAVLRSEVSPQPVRPWRRDRPYDAVKCRGHDIVSGDIRRFGEDS